jgi:NTE family protein
MNYVFNRPISLALSGGGIRAIAYHLGVLKWLAERGLFENVTRISTVSGGSLLMGMVYQSAGFRWPRSEHFLSTSWPNITEQLCSKSLQMGALGQLVWPPNWRFILSRANLVALELKQNWGFDVPMSVLQSGPEWSINGTTAQNGKRFRFKGTGIGDWDVGYAVAPDFPLSCALAVSAAFPIGIGPLTIDSKDFVWRRRDWNEPASAAKVVKLPYEKLHLYDGGLYDNLGTESFFDVGRQVSKHPGDYIIVSDAGAPLTYGMTWGPLSLGRVKRMMDIMSEQTRSLRVRPFVTYLQNNNEGGAFFPIGFQVSGGECQEAQFARTFPTSLKRFDRRDFERLTQYGYDVTVAVDKKHGVCRP